MKWKKLQCEWSFLRCCHISEPIGKCLKSNQWRDLLGRKTNMVYIMSVFAMLPHFCTQILSCAFEWDIVKNRTSGAICFEWRKLGFTLWQIVLLLTNLKRKWTFVYCFHFVESQKTVVLLLEKLVLIILYNYSNSIFNPN